MHICKKWFLAIALLLPLSLFAQKKLPLTVSVFSNATNLPTRPQYLFSPIHPGICAGTAFRYNSNEKHQLGQTAKIGVFHHRYMHTLVQLYSEFTYRYAMKNGLDLGPHIGIGYAHAFSAVDVFKLNSNSEYEKQPNWGRPQFMATTSLEIGYSPFIKNGGGARIFTTYQFWLQTPFVNSYVPLLPNTSWHLGISAPVFNRSAPHADF